MKTNNQVLINKNGRWCETRVSKYYRYKHTIKPLDNLLKELGFIK